MINAVGLAAVTGSTGASIAAEGCVSARTGTGVYTLTLSDQAATKNSNTACIATLVGTSGIVRVEETSTTVKTVKCFAVDGTTATDLDFNAVIFRDSPI